jgi:hypothetical protein
MSHYVDLVCRFFVCVLSVEISREIDVEILKVFAV